MKQQMVFAIEAVPPHSLDGRQPGYYLAVHCNGGLLFDHKLRAGARTHLLLVEIDQAIRKHVDDLQATDWEALEAARVDMHIQLAKAVERALESHERLLALAEQL